MKNKTKQHNNKINWINFRSSFRTFQPNIFFVLSQKTFSQKTQKIVDVLLGFKYASVTNLLNLYVNEPTDLRRLFAVKVSGKLSNKLKLNSNCNFQETLITPDRFIPWNSFFHLTDRESSSTFRLGRPYFVIKTDMQYEWSSENRYIFKTSLKNVFKNVYSFWGLFVFLVLTKEIAFKDFLFINITKFRFFFCSDEADMKRWTFFKDYVYIINFLKGIFH